MREKHYAKPRFELFQLIWKGRGQERARVQLKKGKKPMQIVHVFLLFLFLCLKREFLIVALSTVNVSVRFVLLVLAQLCSDLGESSALWARSSCSARSAGCCAFLLMGCLELSGEGVNTSYYYENKATVWFCHGNVLTWRWIQTSLKSPAGSGE